MSLIHLYLGWADQYSIEETMNGLKRVIQDQNGIVAEKAQRCMMLCKDSWKNWVARNVASDYCKVK